MKTECGVVRDLIPLYLENLTNEGSNDFLQNHIKDCEACKEIFEELKKEPVYDKENKTLDIKDIPPNKLVKRIRNRIVVFVVFALLLGVFANTFGSHFIKIYQTRTAAVSFFEKVSKGDFDQAFTYVSYFDYASDVQPVIPYEDAKKAWVVRVSELKSKGTYVKSYSGLKTWTDDTYPRGEVTLQVVENGVERKYTAQIHFASFDKKWKVQNIYSYDSDEQSELEKALHGYIKADK